MNNTKAISKLKERQLQERISVSGSWHNDYSSAYVFIGNLNYEMNEGDVVIVFSQFGQIVDIHLQRDKVTGKSKGFAFLAYEDRNSAVLAVDNLNGVEVCGRVIRVDHVKQYKPPREFFDLSQEMEGKDYRPTGPDGRGWGQFRIPSQDEEKRMKQYQADKQKNKDNIRRQIGA